MPLSAIEFFGIKHGPQAVFSFAKEQRKKTHKGQLVARAESTCQVSVLVNRCRSIIKSKDERRWRDDECYHLLVKECRPGIFAPHIL